MCGWYRPRRLECSTVKTTTPQNTLDEVIEFFKPFAVDQNDRRLAAIGIASFGPLDLDSHSPQYGYITTTPKPGWTNINLAGIIRDCSGTSSNY